MVSPVPCWTFARKTSRGSTQGSIGIIGKKALNVLEFYVAPRKSSFNGVEFIDCKALPSEQDLDQWIAERQLTLPEDYRRFLLRVNGGRTRPSSFRYPRWTNDSTWGEPQPVETEWMFPKPSKDQLQLLNALAELKAYTKSPPKVRTFCYLSRGDFSLMALLAARKVTRSPDSSSLLPIAFNQANQPIWLSLSESHFGSVFQFDDALDPLKHTQNFARIDESIDLKIADSFSEFVRGFFKGETIMKPGFTLGPHHRRVLSNR